MELEVLSRAVSRGGGSSQRDGKGKQLFKLGAAGDTNLKDNNTKIFLMLKNSKKKNLREKHIINCAFQTTGNRCI